MKKWMIAVAVCLTVHSATAGAAPTTKGSTGMIDTPTADTMRAGQFSLGYYHLNEGNSISVGVNAAKNLELSIAGIDDDGNDRETYFNMKYALKQEGILLPGIAIGVEDIGDHSDRTAYAVVSKALPFGFRVHAGYGNGRYDGLFYALEKSLIPAVAGVFPDMSLIVEHNGHDMNYGLRMSLVSGLKINAGWRDKKTYVGVTYNFY